MKNKKIAKILGVALATGLVFALISAVFVSPVAADETEWSTINTPSWEDNVIVPGADIYDYDVAPDGETIIAIGAISTVEVPGQSVIGITGSFHIDSGTISLTRISEDSTNGVAEVSATLHGDACYVRGYFTAIFQDIDITGFVSNGITAVSGEITYGKDGVSNDDTMSFSGKIYGDTEEPGWGSDDTVSTDLIGADTICVHDGWITDGIDSGIVSSDPEGQAIYRQPRVWKSEDAGVTWDDITGDVQDADSLPGPFIEFNYGGVSIAADDEDWAAIAGSIFNPAYIHMGGPEPWIGPFVFPRGVPGVVATKDGTSNFTYALDMEDASAGTMMYRIYDVDVSIEVDDIHNIAIAGLVYGGSLPGAPPILQPQVWASTVPVYGAVYRLEAGTWLTGSWEDTSTYAGWDNGVPCNGPCWPWTVFSVPPAPCNVTAAVIDGAFSPNFDVDDSYVCMTHDLCGVPYIQSSIWESGGTWNDEAGFTEAVEISNDGDTLLTGTGLRSMGIALPDSYDGTSSSDRVMFIYTNAFNTNTGVTGGWVFRVDDSAISPVCGPSGDPLLASMDVYGDADTGKIMIGKYMDWENEDPGNPVRFDCCAGVSVWHTEELDFCCPQWDGACKDPSGPYMAVVMYSPDGDTAYAATRGVMDPIQVGWDNMWDDPDADDGIGDIDEFYGGLSDESAFSVSRDDGVSFNQIGLIDTDIDYLSDIAVCPNCDTIYLSSINEMDGYDCLCDEIWEVCSCDSVWRSYDNGDTWERINHGDWSEDGWYDKLLLRLPCDAVEDCCDQDPEAPSGTIYLAIQNSDEIYYSRDCGQCWNNPPDTKITIQDVAVESENIVYVLDADGYVSKSTQYGRRWGDKVDTGVGSGHSITSCCVEGFVVVGGDGGESDETPVGWSDDGGESWDTTDDLPSGATGSVHVACATTCENIIYAAVSNDGIYRTDVTDGSWDDLTAFEYGYYGIVVGRSDGTLYAASDYINVDSDPTLGICERFVEPDSTAMDEVYSGVARNLDACETDCCGTEDWDYLICGLGTLDRCYGTEEFGNEPSALRICGCQSAATNSILWAIDDDDYDVRDGSDGTVWTYEDCASKVGPELISPADGAVIDCEPCLGCDAANFTMKWERICNACSYDIEIMDEDGNLIISWEELTITGDPPELYIDGSIDDTVYELACGGTYTWHVREADTDCECIHSQWSETWEFTVAVGALDAIQLLAPDEGEQGVPIENIGFSWTKVTDADSYSFVLAPTAALTGALASQDLSTTAFNYSGPLDYDKSYYWQVKAWKEDVLLTTSSIGVFHTMAEPEEAPPPVVVEPTPAPVIQIPPTQQITPTWIYAIIGIGAALAVVVIVLIVRTRRP